MAKHIRRSKGKSIKPAFFIFCEGESEDAYISFLKSYFRVPIEITSKIAGNSITIKYIHNTLKHKPKHQKDIVYLLYDIDTPHMLGKLKEFEKTVLLLSNPCFELWYILHYCNQNTIINTNDCIKKLKNLCNEYQKGFIPLILKQKLLANLNKAVERARKLTLNKNPSTSIYLLIDELNKLKNNGNS